MKRKRMGVERGWSKMMDVDRWWMGGGDNMDRLPDDLLLNILGRLTFREAATTSLVSPRLLNLRTLSTQLDFKNDPYQPSLSGIHFLKFVNFILNRHRGSQVDSLRIAFDAMGIEYDVIRSSLESWVEFAVRSKETIRSLEIDLHHDGSTATSKESPFCFPLHELYGLKTLTSLSLKYVSILDEDDLAYLLENYLVNLETLVIENAPGLRNLKIIAKKLKRLEIRHCPELCSIDIVSAPNLLSFEKARDFKTLVRVSFCRNALPKLTSVCLRGLLCENVLSEIQEYAPCLEKLEVDMVRICQFPHLRNVKQLVINFGIDKDGITDLTFIIDACPNLEDLTLKYMVPEHDVMTHQWPKPSSHIHTRLRRVTFVGWSGKEYELQLAHYLMGIATNLQMVTFDTNPSDPWWCKVYKDWECSILFALDKYGVWMHSLETVEQLIGSKPGSVAFQYAVPRAVPKDWEVSTYEDWEDNCWAKDYTMTWGREHWGLRHWARKA
ncbi:hypothetical protein OROMI_002190 [Orobanche minor]